MKRYMLWGGLIVAAIIMLVWPCLPIPSASGRLAAIPTATADFHSSPMDLNPDDRTFLGKAEAIQRLIEMRGGGHVILTVTDGSKNRHAVHDPGYCFAGAGWQIQAQTSVKVSSGDATWISLAKGTQTAQALWFFDDGKQQFDSPIEYWLKTSARRATLGRSGPEPVLVTLRSIPNEPVDWDRVRQILLPALGFR
ncbi:MAG: hypothetical protein WCJ66_02965 [Verrucomicrobiota bacterium]